jgi:hypothetical protein
MIKPAVKELFWYLPAEIRRKLVPRIMRQKYEGFQKLRHPIYRERFGSESHPFIEHKFIFVHVPKSAGIAVASSLFGDIADTHRRIVEYQTMLSKREFDSFFKFTFVRNPWDRVVSAFFYLKKGGINARDQAWSSKNLASYSDFDSFVKSWINTKNINSQWHFRPQWQFICLPGKRQPAVDFVGYFENLANDYTYIRKKLGIGVELQNKNAAGNRDRDYRSYYNNETKRIVTDAYSRDIELLGYDFDNYALPEAIAMRDKRYSSN